MFIELCLLLLLQKEPKLEYRQEIVKSQTITEHFIKIYESKIMINYLGIQSIPLPNPDSLEAHQGVFQIEFPVGSQAVYVGPGKDGGPVLCVLVSDSEEKESRYFTYFKNSQSIGLREDQMKFVGAFQIQKSEPNLILGPNSTPVSIYLETFFVFELFNLEEDENLSR